MRRLVLCFVESQLTPCNQTVACTASGIVTCTLPKTPISQCSKTTGLPPIFIQYGVHNLNIKLSYEERYKQSINITASQHNITANDILVRYSDKLIWLIMHYSLQNVICFKHQNQVSCCCEPISYSNKSHVSCLILHSGKEMYTGLHT
jgi:hypothetical protein